MEASERSERALMKTSILAVNLAKWLLTATDIMATSTTELTLIPLNSFGAFFALRS